jgi:hypothetical protein
MREPNENVVQMARAKVRESVQALEALLEWKSVVRIPSDECFGLIDIEHGTVPCDWSRTQVYPLAECLARVRIYIMNSKEMRIFNRLLMILVQYISMNKITLMLIQCFDVLKMSKVN